MKANKALWLLILATSTTANAAKPIGDRFTLICTGTRDSGAGPMPSSFEFRVDLQARRWCDDKCDDVRTFAKVERDQLTLSETTSGSFTESSYVDRRTGDYSQIFRSELVNMPTKAHCDRAPYKPITYRARKF